MELEDEAESECRPAEARGGEESEKPELHRYVLRFFPSQVVSGLLPVL